MKRRGVRLRFTKSCEVCMKDFQVPAFRRHVRTCGNRCHYALKRKINAGQLNPNFRPLNNSNTQPDGTIKLECARCCKTFYRMPWEIRQRKHTPKRVYCSTTCQRKRTGRLVPCAVCGVTKYLSPSQEASAQVHCCGECAPVENGKRLVIKSAERAQANRVHLTCKVCGKPISRPPAKVKGRGSFACSTECQHELFRNSLRTRTVYSAEALSSMLSATGEACAYSGCTERNTGKNIWNLCCHHNQLVIGALSAAKKRRLQVHV